MPTGNETFLIFYIDHQIRMNRYYEKLKRDNANIPDPETQFNPYYNIKSKTPKPAKHVSTL
jgi:hypothetical protein